MLDGSAVGLQRPGLVDALPQLPLLKSGRQEVLLLNTEGDYLERVRVVVLLMRLPQSDCGASLRRFWYGPTRSKGTTVLREIFSRLLGSTAN